MSKAERYTELVKTINKKVTNPIRRVATLIMLFLFIKGFKIKKYFKESESYFVKFWYIILAIPLFLCGIVLDVAINQTVGKDLFGKYYEFGTLSKTIQRVINAGPEAENYEFALQIGTVLNDYDDNHIKGIYNEKYI